MAKPQLEDGHTRIANEILEHLVTMHLSPNQWQVLLCIIRKTYGFQKKVDYIANSQIVEATGLGKTVVSRALHNLEDMKVITRQGKYLGLQKDWERWEKLAEQITFEPKETTKMRIVRTDGYIGIWRGVVEPEFLSMVTKQGYVLEHRLVMARSIGRPLEPWEVVHHKGTKYPLGSLEDKGDNRRENLELLPSQAEHMPSILAQQRIKELEAELAVLLPLVDDNQSKQFSQQKLAESTVKLAKQSTKVSSPRVTQKKKETITKETIQKKGEHLKKKYGEFNNVLLTEEEYQKLKDKWGDVECHRMIEVLSSGMKAKPQKYKYDSHYAAILNWKRREKGGQGGAHREHSKKLVPRDGYTRPRSNPKLDELVKQQRAADKLAGRNQPG